MRVRPDEAPTQSRSAGPRRFGQRAPSSRKRARTPLVLPHSTENQETPGDRGRSRRASGTSNAPSGKRSLPETALPVSDGATAPTQIGFSSEGISQLQRVVMASLGAHPPTSCANRATSALHRHPHGGPDAHLAAERQSASRPRHELHEAPTTAVDSKMKGSVRRAGCNRIPPRPARFQRAVREASRQRAAEERDGR